jgi:hypothetical protein
MLDDRTESIRDVALRSVEVHPARRWGALVELALNCTCDLTTVGAWAREAGMCETQLRCVAVLRACLPKYRWTSFECCGPRSGESFAAVP